jgi:parvulin-like peptidyl-prolyl isomerase
MSLLTRFAASARWTIAGALIFANCSQLLAQQPAASTTKTAADGIMAVVNQEQITRRQVGQQALRRYGQETLEKMVDRYLVLQATKQAGVEVTNEDVQNEVLRTAKKWSLTPESYLRLLMEERGISPEEYASDVVWPMLAQRALVAESVTVTQEEFNQAFIAEFGESVKCRMIMMADRDKLVAVRQQAVADPDRFGQLAAENSEDPVSASVRGLIPPIRHYMGDPAFETLAFSLKEEEISEPYSLGDQWVVLQCVRRLEATPPTEEAFPQVRQQIVDRIRDEKVRAEAATLLTKLRAAAEVTTVLGNAQLSSQYPGVAAIINGQKLTLAQLTDELIKRHAEEILEGEINRRLLTQALAKAKQTVTPQDVDAEVARAAIGYGFVNPDGTADVAGYLADAIQDADAETIALYREDAVWPSVALKKLIPAVTVTEEDIQQGFDKNFGPRVEVLAIVLSDQRTAQKVWDLARNNPTDKYFGELAAQYSVEPTSQSNFGKVPPIRKFGGQPAIENEAFSLKPGSLSSIIATGEKYIIMRCQGMTTPLVSDLEAVRPELVREITERKERLAMATEYDRIRQSAQIDNFVTGTTQDGPVAKLPGSTPVR